MNYWCIIYFNTEGKVIDVVVYTDDDYQYYLNTIELAKREGSIIQYGYF